MDRGRSGNRAYEQPHPPLRRGFTSCSAGRTDKAHCDPEEPPPKSCDPGEPPLTVCEPEEPLPTLTLPPTLRSKPVVYHLLPIRVASILTPNWPDLIPVEWDSMIWSRGCPPMVISFAGTTAVLPFTGTGETRTTGWPVLCWGVNDSRNIMILRSRGPVQICADGS